MNKFILALLLLSSFASFSQAGAEIYLFDLNDKKSGLSISNGKNITNHKGYDNQPYFHPDEPVIYYSSFNEEGRSDIKSYNYKTGVTSNITTTSEREYSPTVTPISNTYPVSFSATTMHRSLANTPSRVVSLLF